MVNGIKNDIRLAIESKGVEVPNGTTFAKYPLLIAAIQGEGSNESGLAGFNLPPRFVYASYKRRITIKKGTILPLAVEDDTKYFIAADDIEINVQDILNDTLEAGKDYYLFLIPDDTNPAGINIKAALTKNAPDGFTTSDVLQFGGFHTLCENVGTGLTYVEGGVTKNHPLNGYYSGDILPESVWCMNHRPYSEPEGMVFIPSLDFWCDIYLQSGSGTNTKSAYMGAITRSRQYVDFVEDQFCVKKALLNDEEFAAAMLGSNEQTSVLGANEASAITGGAGGRKDGVNRRMISIYGVEEGCGSLWQWLATTSAAGSSGWNAQNGGKGSYYGACFALLAGGAWNDAANCGSRSRYAHYSRAHSAAGVGGRGRSRTIREFV
jgi:hypothetical protein